MPNRTKPSKPRPDFPLYAHRNGQWAKRINGKIRYFGPWGKPDEALRQYLEDRDDLYAGRTPRRRGGVAVGELVEQFLAAKDAAVASGELSSRSLHDYEQTCRKLLIGLGEDSNAEDLQPPDWQRYKTWLAGKLRPVSLGNEVNRVRVIMKWAADHGLIAKPNYGQSFSRPSKLAVRRHQRASGTAKFFDAWEVRRLLQAATVQMRAFVLLGVNCGFGQTDIAQLQISSIQAGWVTHPRPKTEVDRRCPIWPETAEAIQEAISQRPRPADDRDAGLAFLTAYGARWVRMSETGKPIDSLSSEFAKLLARIDRAAPRCLLPIQQRGRGFYSLRHVTQTIGEESGDAVAVKHIMGHVDNSMSGVYRERISDQRLVAVTSAIHDWLFADDS